MKSKRCEINGKVCYPEKAALKSVNKAWEYGKYLRAYKCPLDGYWHLTHIKN